MRASIFVYIFFLVSEVVVGNTIDSQYEKAFAATIDIKISDIGKMVEVKSDGRFCVSKGLDRNGKEFRWGFFKLDGVDEVSWEGAGDLSEAIAAHRSAQNEIRLGDSAEFALHLIIRSGLEDVSNQVGFTTRPQKDGGEVWEKWFLVTNEKVLNIVLTKEDKRLKVDRLYLYRVAKGEGKWLDPSPESVKAVPISQNSR